jgi:histidyl-tRNA synthetase
MAALDFLYQWINLRAPIDEALAQINHWIGNDAKGQAILSNWRETLEQLNRYGIDSNRIVIQADLTKNWEYYTGLVFGIQAENETYIVGGGRYDDLMRVLGNKESVPAFGFAYYVDSIFPLLPSILEDYKLITIKSADLVKAVQWACYLRDNGIPIVIDSAIESDFIITTGTDGASFNEVTYSFNERDKLLKELKTQL